MEKILNGVMLLILIFVLYKFLIKDPRYERKAKKRCTVCGSTIPYKARVCPYCRRDPGTDFRSEAKVTLHQNKGILIFAFGSCAIALLLVWIGMLFS